MTDKAKVPRRANGAQSKMNAMTNAPILPEKSGISKPSRSAGGLGGEARAIYLHGQIGFFVPVDPDIGLEVGYDAPTDCPMLPVDDLEVKQYMPGLLRFRLCVNGVWGKRVYSGGYSIAWGMV